MDHWGDPWADNNADHHKSPTKNEVTSPLPPTLAPAPVLLNGFLDDAGWGNEDDSFGDWTTSSGHDTADAVPTETRIAEPSPLKNESATEDGPQWDIEEERDDEPSHGGDAWAGQTEDTSDVDNVASDTSDTSTTIQLDKATDQAPVAPSDRLQPDDDSSARPSTSPSETSRHEAPAESPRTSFEEEALNKEQTLEETKPEEEVHSVIANDEDSEVEAVSSSNDSADEEFGTSTEDTLWTEAPGQPKPSQDATGDSKQSSSERSTSRPASPTTSSSTTAAASHNTGTYQLDTALLDELFPHDAAKELDEAPDDPVYSTSGRKAWYRLTRKQTMREFNSGNGDDNYIRVTWAGSEIRSEVNKTVARWAREDRLSGTGPGARASFYWDTPAPPEPMNPRGHLRTKTSVPTPRAIQVAPARQSLPPVSTDAPAAFNWSSPTSTIDPWKQDSPGLRLIPPPVVPQPTTIGKAQTQEIRAVSNDLTRDVGETQGQTSTETPAVATKAIPPPEPTATSASPWEDLSTPDNNNPNQEQRADVPTDDEDDWGEMISSPTVSTPVSAFPSFIPATLDSTVSTSASPPKTPPIQDRSADAMHIVRLRSTISPTSAIFGPKSYVPFHAEQGPIGLGILKPAKRPVAPTPEKSKIEVLSKPVPEVVQWNEVRVSASPAQDKPVVKNISTDEVKVAECNETEDDDFSAFASSTLVPEPVRPSTPPQASVVPNESTLDAWADADFSFFESAPATRAPAPTTRDPSDPFSVFETPPRPISAASSAKTFTRSSPPRNATPPSIQPLTGATNSAQRRKNEEEQIIKDILAGLPDLSYMLR